MIEPVQINTKVKDLPSCHRALILFLNKQNSQEVSTKHRKGFKVCHSVNVTAKQKLHIRLVNLCILPFQYKLSDDH